MPGYGTGDRIQECMEDNMRYKKRIAELEEENRMLKSTVSILNSVINDYKARNGVI